MIEYEHSLLFFGGDRRTSLKIFSILVLWISICQYHLALYLLWLAGEDNLSVVLATLSSVSEILNEYLSIGRFVNFFSQTNILTDS